jgi:hypothetical protein
MNAHFFEENAACIAHRWPAVWQVLQQQSLDGLEYAIVEGQERTFTVHGVQLSSRHDRDAEAQLQAQHLLDCCQPGQVATLYGTGLGDVPRAWLRLNTSMPLRLVVMNAALFVLVLQAERQTDWLSHPHITLMLADSSMDVQLPFFALPPEMLLADDAAAKLRDRLLTETVTEFANQRFQPNNTVLLEQLQANYGLVVQDKPIDVLFGSAPRRSAWVVGAGPTLQGNLQKMQDYLYTTKTKPLIVCADTAAKTLLQYDIRPDFVVILDYRNTAEHLPVADSSGLALVYFPVVPNATLLAWQGIRYAAYSSSALYQDIRAALPRSNLFAAGSVIHPAIDLAVKMGVAEVVLWGVDFAFPGGRTHTGWDNGALRTYIEHADRWVHNGHGERVQSAHNFISYLCDTERYIAAHPSVKFFNTSKEGAAIAGCAYHPDFVS